MSPAHALKTLIGAVRAISARGAELPRRALPANRDELVTWCLVHAMRVVQPMTLMAMALYHEPRSAFFSAVLADPLSSLLC